MYLVMLKLLLVILSVFQLLFVSSALSVVAGSSPLETAQQDYSFHYTKYRDTYEKHQSALSGYLSFKTATSKQQAFEKSKDYVLQVSSLYLAYNALIREYSNSFVWDNNQEKYDALISKLDAIDAYLGQTQKQLQETKTLEEVSLISSQVKDKLEKEFDFDFYHIFAQYEFISASNLFDDFKKLVSSLSKDGETSIIILNWKSEIADIEQKAQKSLDDAQAKLNLFKDRKVSEGDLHNVQNDTAAAIKQLSRSKSLFREAVKIF